MDLELFVTPGLGDASYLLASGGEAVLVDPQRDAWRFTEVAARRGWRIRHVLETHVHNDYLSGALETKAATGAEICAPARGGYQFEHRPMDEGDALEIGSLRLTAWATPGHTPEHIAWAVSDLGSPAPGGSGDEPAAVFTGGSLLVGTSGRTDLLGPVLTPALTADQQRSLQRFATLPDAVQVLPTHGAGSFCSAGPSSGSRVSTIGAERFANPAFRLADGPAEAFRLQALDGLGRYPDYYAHMAGLNRRGPRVLSRLFLADPLEPAAFEAAAAEGRDRHRCPRPQRLRGGSPPGLHQHRARRHVRRLRRLAPPVRAPVLLVLPEGAPDALATATTELLRIGYERVRGWLGGGVEAWVASGRACPRMRSRRCVRPTTGAVRPSTTASCSTSASRSSGTRTAWFPGRSGSSSPTCRAGFADLPANRPVTVFCRSGSRAAIAASLLDRAGVDVRLVARDGAAKWPEPLAHLNAE
jgi:glyoxylase-like metal-dependent hydrolase (beta-lactamase superfamily II)/rhodanese-related sulfurtransferase